MRTYELYAPRSVPGPYRASDYWKLPDECLCELLYGRFYVSPSPSALHQIVSHLLCDCLWLAAQKSGGVVLNAPMDVVLAEHSVVQPDLLYISAERRHIVSERVGGAPDLVVEIISARSVLRDRVEKMRLYAEAGVKEYWIVDPVEKAVEFFLNRDGVFQVALPMDDLYRSATLPDVQINLAEFWGEVDARLP